MTVERNIAKNMTWMTGGHLAGRLLMFAFTVILARELGAEQFGYFSWVFAFVAFGFIVADMGVSQLTTRELSKSPDQTQQYLENGIVLKLFLSAASALLMVLVIQFLDQSEEVKRLVYWMTLYVLGESYLRFFTSIFRAQQKMEYEALANVFLRVITASFGILILYSGVFTNVLFPIILTYIVGTLIAGLFLFETLRKQCTGLRHTFSPALWKALLHKAWPFALSAFFVGIYYNLDTLMLGVMRTSEEVGWYNAAYRIIFFILLLVTTFQQVLFPVISKLFVDSQDELRRVLRLGSRMLIISTVPIAFGGLFVARDLLDLFYGSEFLLGAGAFSILLWTVVIYSMSVIYGSALQAGGRQRLHLYGAAAGAVVNIILNLLVIPRFGMVGAAFTTLASEIAVLLFFYVQLQRIVPHPILPHVWRPILAGCAMSAVLWFLTPLNVLATILIGGVTYGIVILLIKGITLKELKQLRELASRKS